MGIEWITSFEVALTLAGKESRPILLDFFNPG